MFQMYRLCGPCLLPMVLVLLVLVVLAPCQLNAEQPRNFPWSQPSGGLQAGGGRLNTYRVVPSTLQYKHHRLKDKHHHQADAPAELYPVAQKTSYAYGWFGSNPSHSWGRHFGTSRNYTQWSRR